MSHHNGRRVLVTGASGYVASALIPQLHQRGFTIHGLDKVPAHKSIQQLCDGFSLSDITQDEQLQKVASVHWDVVYHLAALCQVNESLQQPELYMTTNWEATKSLVHQLKYDRFVFVSSAAAKEPQCSTYAQSKLLAEQSVHSSAANRCSVVRLYNVVGCSRTKYTNNPDSLFARLVNARLEGVFTINGDDYPDSPDGTCVRNFIHVEDVACNLIDILDHPPDAADAKPAELAHPEPITVKQFAEAFRRVNQCSFAINVGNRRSGDIPDSQSSTARPYPSTQYASLEKLTRFNDSIEG